MPLDTACRVPTFDFTCEVLIVADTSFNEKKLLSTAEPKTPQNKSKDAVDIKQVTSILFRQRFLIFSVSCLVLSGASLLAFIAKPSYQSSMQVMVSSDINGVNQSNRRQNSNELNSLFASQHIPTVDYNAQLKVMSSDKIIQKAVDLLRKDYSQLTLEDIKGRKDEKTPLTITLQSGEKPANQSFNQVFEISFQGENPIQTQKVLQALQLVYQEYNIEEQKKRLNKGIDFINEKLTEAKKQLAQSERKLEQFRQKNNLVDPEAQAKTIWQSLIETQQVLQSTRARVKDLEAQYQNLHSKLAQSPQKAVIPSHGYQNLLSEIQKTELALAEERQRYTDDSPVVQKLLQQRESQIKLLENEVSGIGKEKNNQPANTTQSLMTPGQLGEYSLKLAQELVEVQTTAIGLAANEQSLIESEKKLRAELSKYPALIGEYNRLVASVQTLRKNIEHLLETEQFLAMRTARTGDSWQVLAEPQPGIYLGGGGLLTLFWGAIIGPFAGVAAAFVWELWNDAVSSEQDLRKITNFNVLGRVPKLKQRRYPKKMPILAWNAKLLLSPDLLESIAGLQFDERFDIVYQNIKISNLSTHRRGNLKPENLSPLGRRTFSALKSQQYKSLLLTSTITGEGTSTIALGLAVSAAKTHQRVLLIDANLLAPSLHKTLELSNDWGLSLLLVDETNTPIKEYVQPVHPAIDVLTAGPIPEDTVKILSSRRLKEIMKFFSQNYDLVLIDAPPVLNSADMRIWASVSEGIVMVSRINYVRRTEVMQAAEILSNLNLIGVVMNQVKRGRK